MLIKIGNICFNLCDLFCVLASGAHDSGFPKSEKEIEIAVGMSGKVVVNKN